MKSVLSSFIAAAIICAVCGCKPRPCAPVEGATISTPGPPPASSGSDQPIKGHDGKLPGKVVADIGSVNVDILNVDSDATVIKSGPDNQIREVDVTTTDSKKITLKDVLIDGVLYGLAKRQIDAPWKITLRDRKGHGIVVATLSTPTSAGRNIAIKTEHGDYFNSATVGNVTTFSLNDQKCHGHEKCEDFDSIEVKAAHARTVVYACGDRNPGTACAIDIGMLHGRKQ
jgi:hypothetical protein